MFEPIQCKKIGSSRCTCGVLRTVCFFLEISHKFMAGEEAEVNIVGCKNIFTPLFSLEFESPRKMRFQCGCGVHSSLLLNCGVDEILMVG